MCSYIYVFSFFFDICWDKIHKQYKRDIANKQNKQLCSLSAPCQLDLFRATQCRAQPFLRAAGQRSVPWPDNRLAENFLGASRGWPEGPIFFSVLRAGAWQSLKFSPCFARMAGGVQKIRCISLGRPPSQRSVHWLDNRLATQKFSQSFAQPAG